MMENKKKTIFRKIFFWIVSFSCIAGLSFSILLFFVFRSDSIINIEKFEMERLSRKEEVLKRIYEENINDLDTIPNLPVLKKFIEGEKGGILTLEEKQNAIEALKIWAETKNHYLQLRLIDAEGQEKLRIERKDDGTIYVVPDTQLQNKASRYYFSQSYSLNKGEYYVSPIDLNREGVEQKIEIPYRPVMRYATPVFSRDGSKYGIFIINNDFTRILKKIEDAEEKKSTFFIVDNDGNYIWHPDQNLQWSGPKDLDRKIYFLGSNPDLWKMMKESSEGAFSLNDYFVYKKIELSSIHDFPTFFVISQIDELSVLVPIYYKIFIIAVVVIFGTFVFSLLAFFAVRRILKPLRKLRMAAEQVENGNFEVHLDVKTGDEIEEFARIFSEMVRKVGDSYKILGEKVREKTETLEKQKVALESQVTQMNNMQKASLNLLEDLDFEKERMMKQIRETEKFRMAVDNASDQIVITDPEGIVLYANKALTKTTGYSPSEAVGKKAAALWKAPMPQEFYKNMWYVIKTQKKEFKSQLKNHNKNGNEYEVELIINPVLDEQGNIMFFVGIERDITKEKMIDRAKTEFVSFASHQLRTPLSTINWYLEILLDESDGKLNDKQKNYIHEVYSGSKRMVDLVNALLNVSRIDLGTFAVDPQPVDIKEISESVFSELMPALTEKQMRIEKKYDEKLPIMNVDPKLIRIVFQNLLSNALKYTPEKGTISLRLEKKKNDMLLTVSDTGYGIPHEQKDRIFEKLFRADNVREKIENGTGLGLYIVKSIVEQSQGKIWFDSELNKGSNFYVSIPLVGMKKKEGTKGLSEG